MLIQTDRFGPKEGSKSESNDRSQLVLDSPDRQKEFTVALYAISILDLSLKLDFKYVRIYFDATTFDRIAKDRAAKFVDMFSAIGGTMGLLTGFSILSGVEILYFTVKIILQTLKKLFASKSSKNFKSGLVSSQ